MIQSAARINKSENDRVLLNQYPIELLSKLPYQTIIRPETITPGWNWFGCFNSFSDTFVKLNTLYDFPYKDLADTSKFLSTNVFQSNLNSRLQLLHKQISKLSLLEPTCGISVFEVFGSNNFWVFQSIVSRQPSIKLILSSTECNKFQSETLCRGSVLRNIKRVRMEKWVVKSWSFSSESMM